MLVGLVDETVLACSFLALPGAALFPLQGPNSSYTFPVEMSYLTFCLLNLSSKVLLFSSGVAEELFEELEKDPGFNGVQLEKFG